MSGVEEDVMAIRKKIDKITEEMKAGYQLLCAFNCVEGVLKTPMGVNCKKYEIRHFQSKIKFVNTV